MMKTMMKTNYKLKDIYFISHFHAYLFSLPAVYETFSIAKAVYYRSFSSASFSFSYLRNQKMICIKKTIVPLLCLQYVVRQNKLISIFVLNGFATMYGLFNTNYRMCDSSVFSYTFSFERTIRYKGCPANYILYNPENFTKENFCNFIINNFYLNTTYSITVKIRFRVDTYFYMCVLYKAKSNWQANWWFFSSYYDKNSQLF